MKILIVGTNGLLGSAAVAALKGRHEVIEASRSSDVSVILAEASGYPSSFRDSPRCPLTRSASRT